MPHSPPAVSGVGVGFGVQRVGDRENDEGANDEEVSLRSTAFYSMDDELSRIGLADAVMQQCMELAAPAGDSAPASADTDMGEPVATTASPAVDSSAGPSDHCTASSSKDMWAPPPPPALPYRISLGGV